MENQCEVSGRRFNEENDSSRSSIILDLIWKLQATTDRPRGKNQSAMGNRIMFRCSGVKDSQTERGSESASRLLSVYQRRT